MSDVKDIFRQLKKSDEEIYSIAGKVVSVDLQAGTCEIQPLNGDADLLGVRLQAQAGNSGLLMVPKVNSTVIVTFMNKLTGYVALCSEVESCELVIGGTSIKADSEGVEITKGEESLKAVISDLCEALAALTVTCAAPGSISSTPVNMASFTAINQRLNNLFRA